MAPQQKEQIDKIKSLGGYDAIKGAIDNLSSLSVLVMGEPINDIYRFVSPEGISSKSPTVSARFQYEEEYDGGSLAIANHLGSFCKKISKPTIYPCEKIRYISGIQRIFEVTKIDESIFDHNALSKFILNRSHHDCIIAADFGHGLFEGPVLEAMKEVKGFVGLNVQANSSNFGFNVYKKHSRFDYLCLDTREARLATYDRYSSPRDVAHKILIDIGSRYFSLTKGPTGAIMWKPEHHGSPYPEHTPFECPAFSDTVIDATGAGDAYFAITSVLLATHCVDEFVPFIGNVFASLKTKIIGNKRAVTKDELLNVLEGLLE